MHQARDHACLFDLVNQPVPVPDRLHRDRRAGVPLGQELPDRAASMAQPCFPHDSFSWVLDTGQCIVLVRVERDILHLRLLSYLGCGPWYEGTTGTLEEARHLHTITFGEVLQHGPKMACSAGLSALPRCSSDT